VHIGTEGTVVAQTPIPGRPVADDSCHLAFRDSVGLAVAKWRFFPATRRTCRVASGAPPDCSEVPIQIFVDIEFTFDVVEGRGVVRSQQ